MLGTSLLLPARHHPHYQYYRKIHHRHRLAQRCVQLAVGGQRRLARGADHQFLVDTDFGYGGAISVVLTLAALLIALGYNRVLRPST